MFQTLHKLFTNNSLPYFRTTPTQVAQREAYNRALQKIEGYATTSAKMTLVINDVF